MKYLCDTNIFIQILRNRAHKQQCAGFLNQHLSECAISMFAVFAFCILARKFGEERSGYEIILELPQNGLQILEVEPRTALMFLLESRHAKFDYDDSLHYQLAKEHNLTLV